MLTLLQERVRILEIRKAERDHEIAQRLTWRKQADEVVSKLKSLLDDDRLLLTLHCTLLTSARIHYLYKLDFPVKGPVASLLMDVSQCSIYIYKATPEHWQIVPESLEVLISMKESMTEISTVVLEDDGTFSGLRCAVRDLAAYFLDLEDRGLVAKPESAKE